MFLEMYLGPNQKPLLRYTGKFGTPQTKYWDLVDSAAQGGAFNYLQKELANVQTFLPFQDYAASAACLDRARLGKQRVEAQQVLTSLLAEKGLFGEEHRGWKNHPITRMWRGYERALLAYLTAICSEWTDRGYNNGLTGDKLIAQAKVLEGDRLIYPVFPEEVHQSHRDNLCRKWPEFYLPLFEKLGVSISSNYAEKPYVWASPVNQDFTSI